MLGTSHAGTNGFVHYSPSSDWEVHRWEFDVPAACSASGDYYVSLRNMYADNNGNDFYIDDITLEDIGPASLGNGGIDCPPAAPEADLSITKTSSNAGAVVPGGTVSYTLVVTNHAGVTVTGAVVTDSPGVGLNCPASNAVTCSSTASPSACPSGPLTVGALLSPGITLGALPSTSAANTATFTFDCTVTATGLPVP